MQEEQGPDSQDDVTYAEHIGQWQHTGNRKVVAQEAQVWMCQAGRVHELPGMTDAARSS
jgi:hypothetical protein